MKDVDLIIKAYMHNQPLAHQMRAKFSLQVFLLALLGYNQIADLGIAGVLVFQSKDGNKCVIVRKWQ